MSPQSETIGNLNKQYRFLQDCFRNMPIDGRVKKGWLARAQKEHALSLLILGNAGLRDQPIKNFEKLSTDSSLKVVREMQTYSTLLDNMITFSQNQGDDFYKFITLDRMPATTGIMDLFSVVPQDSREVENADCDWKPSIDSVFEGSPYDDFYAVLQDAFAFFVELNPKQGYKKFSTLYFFYVALQYKTPNLINIPLVFLHALEELQQIERKKNLGRRHVAPVSVSQIQFNLVLKHVQIHVNQAISRLQNGYRLEVGYAQQDVRSKVCMNFAFSKAFEIVPSLQSKGFTYENVLIKKLFTQGHLTEQDIDKKDFRLIAEIIEEEHMITPSDMEGIAYYLNVVGTEMPCLGRFNKLPEVLKLKKSRVAGLVSSAELESDAGSTLRVSERRVVAL